VTLTNEDDETTVVRFNLDANGDVQDINHLQKKFTNYGLEVLQ
jgi:hypothetical protein